MSTLTTPVDDPDLIALARDPGVVAIVGFSPSPARPVFGVAQALLAAGVTCYLVNPQYAGQQSLGQTILGSLAEVPQPIRIVDVFRRAEGVLPIAEEAIAVGAQALWLQLGIFPEAAIALARGAGLTVIVDRCLKVEHQRYAH